ncbi:MAG: ATP-binding protein, partial [Alphaproteobacteria bacterium]
MDARLHQIVLDRIEADDSLGDEAGYFVLAACDGDEALARALGGAADAGAVPPTPPAVVDPPPVYLESITVEGFRGIGPSVRLGLEPGPGLTVIAGRNGSGKSSFAEGLELCLTGSNRRWSDRSKTWQQAWRNLHQEHPVALTAELCVEGVADAVSVERRWEEGADLDDCVVRVRGIPGVDSLDGIGWTGPLVAYRPFLSYNELGDMFEGRPTAFFDAMAGILGIEDLAALAERLRQSRLERDRALREVTDRVPDLRKALDGVDDERARACARALASPTWDLAGLESTLDGVAEEGRPESGRTLLAALAQIDVQPVEVTPAQLTAAADAVAACVATDAGRARRLVALLSAALHEHEIGGDQACPVCASGRLDGDWARATSDQIELLRREAETADQAEREAGRLIEAVRRSMGPVPSVLSRAQAVGVDATAARE